MKMKKTLAKIFLIVFGSLGISMASDELNLEEATLKNGLKVVVLNTKANGVVFTGVGYHVGSGDDPRSVVGISHVLEHMMFKGTKNMSGEELKKIIFVYNKYSNAFTSFDITVYVHTSSKSFLDVNLKIEADRMQNLQISEKALDSEKEVIKEERKMRIESNPLINHMEEASWKVMYLFSNYSYSPIGYMDQIEACTKEEVSKHYKKFYKPNNAFILLVGDITMKEALPKVEKYFGCIKKGADIDRKRVIDPKETGLSFTMEHKAKNISVHNLNLIYKVDRKLFDDMKKLTTLGLIVGMLGRGASSVLYQQFVDKEQLAYNIGVISDIRAFDKGRINISAVFKEGQDEKNVENKITHVVNEFATKHLTKERFEAEKRKTIDEIEKAQDNPQEMGMQVIGYIATGYQISEINKMKSVLKEIKFEDVVDIAKQIFTPRNKILKIYSHPEQS